jgi:TolB-like protein/thioredoxin-like negative regulator of GroEL
VLYEMLTGRAAFAESTASATIAKRLSWTPPPVTESRRDVSTTVARLVARLLARNAADRHPTGSQVVADLRSSDVTPGTNTPAPSGTPAPPAVKSIAVLPFANVSADSENEFFSDGLTDEIITDLSGVKGLRLVSRNSSMQLKGSEKPLRDIGRDLGVRYLLSGSVRKAGNALRITAQLVDPETDTPLWAEKYSGTMDDVFDVQERVSRAIVNALEVKLSSEEDARLGARRIRDPRAFELYLQARSELRHYGVSLERAAALLQRAIDIEGETPPLRALRAFMEFSKVRGGTHTDLRPLDVAESEAHALITPMPDAPFGHALLGFVAYERGDLPRAAKHLAKAHELDPTDADVMFGLCITLQAGGQIEPAVRLAEQFHEADPLSPFSGAMMVCGQWFAGNIGRHVEKLESGLAMDPQNAILNWALGYTYALMGRTADAARHADWMRANASGLPYTAQLVSLVEAARGNAGVALETIRSVDLQPLDAHQTFHIAESYAMAGDTSKALELLEFAVDHGMYPYLFYRDFCPFMQPLRGMAAFDRIVAKAEKRVREFEA